MAASLLVVVFVLLIALPGVIAAVRAERKPEEDPDYGVEAQVHALNRQLFDIHEALAQALATPLPERLISDPNERAAERRRVTLALEVDHAHAQERYDHARKALRDLPKEAPVQAREIIAYALDSADRCLYQHDLLARDALRYATPEAHTDPAAAVRLHQTITATRREAERLCRRVLEEARELQEILALD